MVHALREAHRLLKPGGVLVDLHPAPIHRRVGVLHGGRFHPVGAMRESLAHVRAANRAVDEVLRLGLFRQDWRARVECRRVIDTLAELEEWFANYGLVTPLPPHDWLVRWMRPALAALPGRKKIAVIGPLSLRVLLKR